MKFFFTLLTISIIAVASPLSANAQTIMPTALPSVQSKASTSAELVKIKHVVQNINDIVNPELDKQKTEVLTALNEKRHANTFSFVNFAPFAIQYAINAGVPTNTIVLIL